MRREFKVGLLVSLSVALVAAIYIGRALARRGQPEAIETAFFELPVTPAPVTPAAMPAERVAPAQSSADQELDKILAAVAAAESAGQPAHRETVPLSAVAADKPAARPSEAAGTPTAVAPAAKPAPAPTDATEKTAIETLLDDVLDERRPPAPPAREKSAAPRAPAAAQKESAQRSQPAPLAKPQSLAALDKLDTLLDGVGEGKAGAAKPASLATSLDSRPPAAAPPAGTGTYVIQPGDSFWKIAEKVYGKGHLADALAAANPQMDEFNLQAGKKLVLPPLVQLALPQPVQPALPAGARMHTVRPGETLWDIAAERYGDGYKWRLIAAANPQVNPHLLPVGSSLLLPADNPGPAEAAAAEALPAGWRRHVIRDGDKLWDIAVQYYGSGILYRALVEANPDIADVHHLTVGKVLLIPPKPAE